MKSSRKEERSREDRSMQCGFPQAGIHNGVDTVGTHLTQNKVILRSTSSPPGPIKCVCSKATDLTSLKRKKTENKTFPVRTSQKNHMHHKKKVRLVQNACTTLTTKDAGTKSTSFLKGKKKKAHDPGILYPSNLSFKKWGQVKDHFRTTRDQGAYLL